MIVKCTDGHLLFSNNEDFITIQIYNFEERTEAYHFTIKLNNLSNPIPDLRNKQYIAIDNFKEHGYRNYYSLISALDYPHVILAQPLKKFNMWFRHKFDNMLSNVNTNLVCHNKYNFRDGWSISTSVPKEYMPLQISEVTMQDYIDFQKIYRL